jgi:RHS repeat-associated protein
VTTAYAYKPDGQVSARGGDTFTWDGRGRLAGGSFPSFSGTQFRVDGNSVGGPVAGGSPTRQLDTTTLANGWHTIGATASDRNGKQGAAPSRVINVQNGAQPASQIQFVKQLGPATTTAAASTVTLAVPATGVGAGQTLIVLAGKAGTKVTAVSDSKANTYAADRSSIANGATNVAVYSGRVTSALTSSDTITVTFGSATANPAVAFALEFSGIAAPPSKTDEVGAGKTGSGTALITSTTNATDHPVELVVAGFGASVSSAFTAASGYTKATSGSTAVGTATLAVHGAWRVTTQQGPQSTSGTLATSGKWASGIVTYRAADLAAPTQPGALTASNAPGTTALAWTASSDSSGVAYYHVHRSTSSNFTPGTTNEIGQTTLTSYTDNGDGTTNGLAGGTYYYKVIAEDGVGNRSAASAQAASTVTADTGLPKVALTAPTAGSQQTGTSTLAATASDPTPAHALSYGFDAAGFRRSRTLDGVTTRHLLGGLIETTSGGTITVFDVDGPAGDLIHYDGPPTTATPTYLYYSGHGDLAAQLVGTQTTPTAANVLRYDPFGEPINAPFGSNQTELFTGGWDKKFDPVSDLVEMGARPYDANLGRFYEVDPVDGGSLNGYEYAGQDPINGYDLDGRQFACAPCDGGAGAWLEHQFTGTPPLVLKIEMTLKTPMGAVVLGLMVGKGGKAYYYGWDPLGRGAVSLSGAATLEDGTVESGNHIELSGTFCFHFVCQGFDTHHHSSLGIRLPGRGEPFEASLKITRVRKF